MESDTLPQTSSELRNFILKTVEEVSDRIIPTVSDDEQEDINKIYGNTLEKDDYDKSDCVRL